MLYALVAGDADGATSADRPPTAGLLGSVTLLASAAGGIVFGVIADRFGRTRALMGSILSTRSSPPRAACADRLAARACAASCSASAWAASGRAARRSWRRPGRPQHRGKALGFMQSSWAIGYARGGAGHRRSCCRPTAGARCSSSACCRRCSRCGSGATSRSRRSGSGAANGAARAVRVAASSPHRSDGRLGRLTVASR